MHNQQQYAAGHMSGVAALSKIELHFSASNLKNMDLLSKSDPQLQIFLEENGKYKEIGRTELINDNLNPKWTRSLMMDYYFESVQRLKIKCWDIDNVKLPMDKQDFIGELIITIADIVSHGGRVSRSLVNPKYPKGCGVLHVDLQEIRDMSTSAELKFSAQGLDNKDLFGKSDGFIRISKATDASQSSWTTVHQTEVVKNNLNPIWQPFSILMSKLNNGDLNAPLLIQCYDWNASGKEDFIGEFKASFNQLKQAGQFPLINPKKANKRKYKNSGMLMVLKAVVARQYSFVEFIQGGTQINMMCAVDFTASNGNPKSSSSLHYRAAGQPSEYVQAISAVGNILGSYDHDGMFPTYGFGAKIPPRNQVSHCFPLSFQQNPELPGVQGIIDAYNQALDKVTLYGPTNFADFLGVATQIGQQYHQTGGKQFLVVLVITDGEITDMEKTTRKIVDMSHLPISIVIMGVGKADFKSMDVLDADDTPLSYAGKTMVADIVQFVPFRQFKGNPAMLAREVLHEIPGQMTSYMKRNNIQPSVPQYRPMGSGQYAQASFATGGAPMQAPQQQQQYGQQQQQYGQQPGFAQQGPQPVQAGGHYAQQPAASPYGGNVGGPQGGASPYGGAVQSPYAQRGRAGSIAGQPGPGQHQRTGSFSQQPGQPGQVGQSGVPVFGQGGQGQQQQQPQPYGSAGGNPYGAQPQGQQQQQPQPYGSAGGNPYGAQPQQQPQQQAQQQYGQANYQQQQQQQQQQQPAAGMPAGPPPGPPPAMAPAEPRATAIQAYQARSPTEVSFAQGETVVVHKQDPSGWSEVTNAQGQKGWCPSNWLNVQPAMPAGGPPSY